MRQMGNSLRFDERQAMPPSLSGERIVLALLASLAFFAAAWPAYGKRLPSHPINLNTATLRQLEELPDVGSVMAHAILKFREYSGPFERVDDLLAIRGISHRRLDKIRPYVYVGRERKYPRATHTRSRSEKNAPRRR